MTKYIWITILVIAFVMILAFKQAPKEPYFASEGPKDGNPSDAIPSAEEGEPIISESGNIKVTRPQPQAAAESPLLIKGEARVFENTFQIRLKDSNEAVLVEKTAMANAPDMGQFGPFGELLLFDKPNAGTGMVEIFSYSAKDGAVQDLVSIPVRF